MKRIIYKTNFETHEFVLTPCNADQLIAQLKACWLTHTIVSVEELPAVQAVKWAIARKPYPTRTLNRENCHTSN